MRRCADGAAVIGVGDLPENYVGIAGLDAAGVAEGNVIVDLAVNQKDRHLGGYDRIFWRNLLHIEAVLQSHVQESEFDDGAEEGASEPGTEVKGLPHAVVGDLAETGEGRFGGDGAEAGLDGERLQELGGAHGFAESEDAVRVILSGEEAEPLVNIITFEKAVGGELTSTSTVGACVGKKHGESVSEEELCVSGHADAVVAETVEENDGIAVTVVGMDRPGAEGNGIGRGDGNVFEIGIELVSGLAHGGFVFRS